MRGDGPPGAQRLHRMDIVKLYLQREGASTYRGISHGTGLTMTATMQAIRDLHRWDDEVLAIPASGNSWRTRLGWTLEARTGEISQLRHNSTRLYNQSHRFEKIANASTNPFEANMFREDARSMRDLAITLDHHADVMESAL